MRIKKDIARPEFMKAAIRTRSHQAGVEILIALLLYLIGSIALSVLETPALMGYLLTNREYISMLRNGDFDTQKIIQLAADLPDWLTIVTLFLEAVLIVLFILYCRFFEKRKGFSMGFRKKRLAIDYVRGAFFAVCAFGIAYLLCAVTGSVQLDGISADGSLALYLIGFFFGYLVQGMAEEVMCRGYLMVSLTRRYSVCVSVIFSALFFALLHGMNQGLSFLAFINLFLFGVVMSLLMIYYENIWVAGAFHGIWNFVQGNIFGVSVSGLGKQHSLFETTSTESGAWLNGGSFGMEGGFAVTLILLAAAALLLWRMQATGRIIDYTPADNVYDRQHEEAVRQRYEQYRQYQQQNDSRYGQNPPYQQQNDSRYGQNPYYQAQNGVPNVGSEMPVNQAQQPNAEASQEPSQKQTIFDKNYFKD